MEVHSNQQPLSATSLAWTQVAMQGVAMSSCLVCWSFRWMRRSKRGGMKVRAEDWLALAALAALTAYTIVSVLYGIVRQTDIPPASRLPLQCGIVLTQVSQAISFRAIKDRGGLLQYALPSTVVALGLWSVILVMVRPNAPMPAWRAKFATVVTFLTECITSGSLISAQWLLHARSRKTNRSRKINRVQIWCIILWLGRICATGSSLVMACVAAAVPSLVHSSTFELDLLIVLGYLVVVAPGAGPLSEGRQWYLHWNSLRRSGAAPESSLYRHSENIDTALDGTSDNGGDVASVSGSATPSTTPLTGRDARGGASTTNVIECDDSRRSISSTTATDATPWKGSASATTLPLTVIAFNEAYGRHGEGKTSLSPGDYHILRHHNLSVGPVRQLIHFLEQNAQGCYELTDGSFEIIVHKNDRDRLVNGLHKTFPASAVDSTYNPLAASADKPVHVARYEYICRLDELKRSLGRSSPLVAVYEHWLQEWSEKQDMH